LSCWRLAIRVRTAVITALYRKLLHFSPKARKAVNEGRLLALVTGDTQKLMDIWAQLYLLVTAPLSIAASFALIWVQVQWSTLAGVGVIVSLFPVNAWMAKVSVGDDVRRGRGACTFRANVVMCYVM
jgi:ATP-binding cassette subfamily C (CFTR/MRP) protein 1